MRHAPAVRVPSVAGPLWRALPVVLYALTAAVMVGWPMRWLGMPPWVCAGAAAAAAAFAVLACLRLHKWPEQTLQWDGTRWSLQVGASSVDLQRVELMLDWGYWLLLRVRTASGAELWLPLHRRDAAGDFRALCRAVYAPSQGDDIVALSP
jgi:hypothetical protein